jgi:hypothetical protein
MSLGGTCSSRRAKNSSTGKRTIRRRPPTRAYGNPASARQPTAARTTADGSGRTARSTPGESTGRWLPCVHLNTSMAFCTVPRARPGFSCRPAVLLGRPTPAENRHSAQKNAEPSSSTSPSPASKRPPCPRSPRSGQSNDSDQSAATFGPSIPLDATAARLHPMVRRTKSGQQERAADAGRGGLDMIQKHGGSRANPREQPSTARSSNTPRLR